MTFNQVVKHVPVKDHKDFKLIGPWAYNNYTGLAFNQKTGERMMFQTWEEFLIEKLVLEEYVPEWQMQVMHCG